MEVTFTTLFIYSQHIQLPNIPYINFVMTDFWKRQETMHMSKAGMALCVAQESFILISQYYEGDPQQVVRNNQHQDINSTRQS